MLRTLRIRNLVIIDDLSVEFGPGVNLLTGETGAGKSILIDAVGLLVGERADRSLVRAGEAAAVVEALFELRPGSSAERLAIARGLMDEGGSGELLVRREVAADGAHRIQVNGSPCTLALLKEIGDELLELHGQHEHQTLLSARRHLELLDRFGGHAAAVRQVAEAWEEVDRRARELDELRRRQGEGADRQARLQAEIREIEAVAPRPGELDTLDRERRVLQHAASLSSLLDEVVGLTYEGEPAAAELTAAAARRAAEMARIDTGLVELAERLQSAAVELQDVGAALRDYRERADFNPGRLEDLEARRVALERLRLRYGKDEAEVLAHRDRAREELARLANIDAEVATAERAHGQAQQRYAAAAGKLSAARAAAAARLVPAVEAELRHLALGEAALDVAFQPAAGPTVAGPDGACVPLTRHGADRVEFLLAANPGEPFRPLSKVASGGELSRIMLALHGIFDAAGEGRSLIFDEVDAGIGGTVADAVGKRLGQLSRRHQVFCVTHLPQVARQAGRHLALRKLVAQGRTRVEAAALDESERIEELARMLGGRELTETSLRHAAELLAGSAGPRRRGRGGRRTAGAPADPGEV